MDDSFIIDFLLSDDQCSDIEYAICDFSEELNIASIKESESITPSIKANNSRINYANIGATKKKRKGKQRSDIDHCTETLDIMVTEEFRELDLDENELFGSNKSKPRKKKTKGQHPEEKVQSVFETVPILQKGQFKAKSKAKKVKNRKDFAHSPSQSEINPVKVEKQKALRSKRDQERQPIEGKNHKQSRPDVAKKKKSEIPEIHDEGMKSSIPDELLLQKSKRRGKKQKKVKVPAPDRQRTDEKIDNGSNSIGNDRHNNGKSNLNEQKERSNGSPTQKSKKSKRRPGKKNTDTFKNKMDEQ